MFRNETVSRSKAQHVVQLKVQAAIEIRMLQIELKLVESCRILYEKGATIVGPSASVFKIK